MLKTTFTLLSKRSLTHDVYELIYACPDISKETPKAGQYVMFQLAPGLNRSYSIASFTSDTFTLIIKKIPDGKGSPMICDALIGQVFTGMLPLGHFVLRDTRVSKCFIGTGTGFAPLYCQLLGFSDIHMPSFGNREHADTASKVSFIFGVRHFVDSFYTDEIISVGKKFADFQYVPYLSQDEYRGFQKGYVTDWITVDNIAEYQEFYLCGSPAMVKSAREKLEALGVEKEKIFWEQF